MRQPRSPATPHSPGRRDAGAAGCLAWRARAPEQQAGLLDCVRKSHTLRSRLKISSLFVDQPVTRPELDVLISRCGRACCCPQVNLVLTTPEATLDEVAKLLDGPPSIEGLPVVDSAKQVRCRGTGWVLVERGCQDKALSSRASCCKITNMAAACPSSCPREFHFAPAWMPACSLTCRLPAARCVQLVGVVSRKDLNKGGPCVQVPT